MKLLIIINGEEVTLTSLPPETLGQVQERALVSSRNTGRPPEEWELRDETGALLDPTKDVSIFLPKASVRLFLSLRVGFGGAHYTGEKLKLIKTLSVSWGQMYIWYDSHLNEFSACSADHDDDYICIFDGSEGLRWEAWNKRVDAPEYSKELARKFLNYLKNHPTALKLRVIEVKT